MQSSFNYDIILTLKGVNFFKLISWGPVFVQAKELFSSVKKCKLKIIFFVTSLLRHQAPFDTHVGGAINGGEMHVCTHSSSAEVKAYAPTLARTHRKNFLVVRR